MTGVNSRAAHIRPPFRKIGFAQATGWGETAQGSAGSDNARP